MAYPFGFPALFGDSPTSDFGYDDGSGGMSPVQPVQPQQPPQPQAAPQQGQMNHLGSLAWLLANNPIEPPHLNAFASPAQSFLGNLLPGLVNSWARMKYMSDPNNPQNMLRQAIQQGMNSPGGMSLDKILPLMYLGQMGPMMAMGGPGKRAPITMGSISGAARAMTSVQSGERQNVLHPIRDANGNLLSPTDAAAQAGTLRGVSANAESAVSGSKKYLTPAEASAYGLPLSATQTPISDLGPMALKLVAPKNQAQFDPNNLDPQVRDLFGRILLAGGTLPGLGRNPLGALNVIGKSAVAQNSGQVPDVASAKSERQANTANLTQQQKSLSSLTAYNNTLTQAIGKMRKLVNGLPDTGSPVINQIMRPALFGAEGNRGVQQARQQLEYVRKESQRLLTSGTSVNNNPLTESDKKSLQSVMGDNFTKQNLLDAMDLAELDGSFRIASQTAAVRAIQDQLKSPGGTTEPNVPTVPPAVSDSARTMSRHARVKNFVNGLGLK